MVASRYTLDLTQLSFGMTRDFVRSLIPSAITMRMRKRPPLRAWAVLPDVDGGSRDRVSATELTLWAGFRRVASLVDSRT